MSSNGSIRADGSVMTPVSLVITIRNEATQLPDLLESIAQQTLPPSEIIIVDGGSTDDSLAILEPWRKRLPIHIVKLPGANIARGRNVGISQSTHEFVAVTDAGVYLEPPWLEWLIAPLAAAGSGVDVVGGFFEPDCRNGFETALAASTLPDADEVEPRTFLPSSRSLAFRRNLFDAGVCYPEWLDYCEDLVFDLRARNCGATFTFQPDAVVRFRPRPDLGSFFLQYFRYARGDGKAGLFRNRHIVRYATYLGLIPSYFLLRHWALRLAIIGGAVAYMRQPARRLQRRKSHPELELARLVMLAGLLRAVGDLAKMAGYPVGLWWRARHYGLRESWRTITGSAESLNR